MPRAASMTGKSPLGWKTPRLAGALSPRATTQGAFQIGELKLGLIDVSTVYNVSVQKMACA